LCKGKTHHPQCTLPKVSCIVVWLFFSKSGSIRWSFLRFKADLSSRESLYLIGLNPNRSKFWMTFIYTLYIIPEGVLYHVILHPTNIKVYIWILEKKRLKKHFWHFGQTLMDDYKLLMIFIFWIFKAWKRCNLLMKTCLENF
jgi:hypothetical protein